MNGYHSYAIRTLISASLLLLSVRPAVGMDLGTFKDCIGRQGTELNCTLDPKPNGDAYIVGLGQGADTGPLYIERASINVYGTWLRRQAGYTGVLLGTSPDGLTPGSSLFISTFQIDGNKAENPAGPFYDADLAITNTSAVVFLVNFWMINSPRIALAVYPGTSAFMAFSGISNARYEGIWVGPNTNAFNLYVTTVFDCGSNGLMFCGRNGYIENSGFDRNHRGCPYGINGGQVLTEPSADNVTITNSYVTNGPAFCDSPNGAWWAEGLEIYGSRITIANTNVIGNGGHGIQVGGANTVNISTVNPDKWVRWNSRRTPYAFNGIWVQNVIGPNSNIVIDQATSVDGHLTGIRFDSDAPNSRVSNNCVRGNNTGVYFCSNCYGVARWNNPDSGCGPP